VSPQQHLTNPSFTASSPKPTLTLVSLLLPFRRALLCSLLVCAVLSVRAQQSPEKAAEKTPEKAPENPAQIELLETRYRFESSGESQKEVHARVHINNELGVRQFSRLTFDYNRSFQQVEIPAVHITHASGGTADILPNAVADQPNPSVVDVPAYQDVRVKSVRILGLAPGDILEYRVVTTTTHQPLAPDFWLEHNFDRSGVVSRQVFVLDLPASRFRDPDALQASLGTIYTSVRAPKASQEKTGSGKEARLRYTWDWTTPPQSKSSDDSKNTGPLDSDVVVTTFSSWDALAQAIAQQLYPGWLSSSASQEPLEIAEKRRQLLAAAPGVRPEESVYNFVSQKIRTVDLPLGSTGFHGRSPAEVLSSGYGTSEDKALLFVALVGNDKVLLDMVPNTVSAQMRQSPSPSMFKQLLLQVGAGAQTAYLDPSLEVAPFGVIPADLRGKDVLLLRRPAISSMPVARGPDSAHSWHKLSTELPFKSSQKVVVDASISPEGTLNAKVRYTMRGDNELLLRVAFHQSPREKWKDVAQLLALSDGFRGKILSASASDPYATKQPFTVEYEISQPKFIDWSKKPVRIFALLPFLGLPDPPAKPEADAASNPIDLGTPLNVDTRLTLHLPRGASAQGPTGTTVERDYATFTSHYAAEGNVVFASRHINFILREVPAARAADYKAFLHAVQTDQSQIFTLEREAAVPAAAVANPASPTKP
jgi:hypothetical protein